MVHDCCGADMRSNSFRDIINEIVRFADNATTQRSDAAMMMVGLIVFVVGGAVFGGWLLAQQRQRQQLKSKTE